MSRPPIVDKNKDVPSVQHTARIYNLSCTDAVFDVSDACTVAGLKKIYSREAANPLSDMLYPLDPSTNERPDPIATGAFIPAPVLIFIDDDNRRMDDDELLFPEEDSNPEFTAQVFIATFQADMPNVYKHLHIKTVLERVDKDAKKNVDTSALEGDVPESAIIPVNLANDDNSDSESNADGTNIDGEDFGPEEESEDDFDDDSVMDEADSGERENDSDEDNSAETDSNDPLSEDPTAVYKSVEKSMTDPETAEQCVSVINALFLNGFGQSFGELHDGTKAGKERFVGRMLFHVSSEVHNLVVADLCKFLNRGVPSRDKQKFIEKRIELLARVILTGINRWKLEDMLQFFEQFLGYLRDATVNGRFTQYQTGWGSDSSDDDSYSDYDFFGAPIGGYTAPQTTYAVRMSILEPVMRVLLTSQRVGTENVKEHVFKKYLSSFYPESVSKFHRFINDEYFDVMGPNGISAWDKRETRSIHNFCRAINNTDFSKAITKVAFLKLKRKCFPELYDNADGDTNSVDGRSVNSSVGSRSDGRSLGSRSNTSRSVRSRSDSRSVSRRSDSRSARRRFHSTAGRSRSDSRSFSRSSDSRSFSRSSDSRSVSRRSDSRSFSRRSHSRSFSRRSDSSDKDDEAFELMVARDFPAPVSVSSQQI